MEQRNSGVHARGGVITQEDPDFVTVRVRLPAGVASLDSELLPEVHQGEITFELALPSGTPGAAKLKLPAAAAVMRCSPLSAATEAPEMSAGPSASKG